MYIWAHSLCCIHNESAVVTYLCVSSQRVCHIYMKTHMSDLYIYMQKYIRMLQWQIFCVCGTKNVPYIHEDTYVLSICKNTYVCYNGRFIVYAAQRMCHIDMKTYMSYLYAEIHTYVTMEDLLCMRHKECAIYSWRHIGFLCHVTTVKNVPLWHGYVTMVQHTATHIYVWHTTMVQHTLQHTYMSDTSRWCNTLQHTYMSDTSKLCNTLQHTYMSDTSKWCNTLQHTYMSDTSPWCNTLCNTHICLTHHDGATHCNTHICLTSILYVQHTTKNVPLGYTYVYNVPLGYTYVFFFTSQWHKKNWDIRMYLYKNTYVYPNGTYRVAKTHRIPYLYRSFSAKVTYI